MATVLIVDDSRTSRKILRNILTENGYEIIGEASDGQTGYEKYIELKPDLVTLDKVIMVTAAGQKSKMVEAIKLGASEFIQKPFEPEQILSVIKTVI